MQLKFKAVASFLAFVGVCTAQIDVHSLRAKAQRGDPASQYALAVMYENNARNVPDWNEAAWWYRHAAEQGDVDAQRRLAWCYENGRGVNLDFDKALKWYLKAAEH
ncbi:MAG: sel1 repeat family protein, partial [Muribaculaceae bacterium]|nr:sel1 repeat family protein [Muribaculaceae bacterium]